jgi:2-dehydro-3-deoxygluconokinase
LPLRAGHVVTVGETLVLLHPLDPGSTINAAHQVGMSVAGADSNFAIAMNRLGWPAIWLSAVSDDPLGDFVVEMVGREGVDVSEVRRDPSHPTGILFKFRHEGRTKVVYYRRGSAASHLLPGWLTPELFNGAALLHLNGVTCALSDSCAATAVRAVALARQASVPVSLDLNLRLQLWDLGKARRALRPIIAEADFLLSTEDELLAFSGCTKVDDALIVAASFGPQIVVVKRGPLGAIAHFAGKTVQHPGFIPPVVVDEVGAGDGFDAGFLSAILLGAGVDEALRYGNLVGAAAVTVADDISGYPTSEQAEIWLESWPVRGTTGEVVL